MATATDPHPKAIDDASTELSSHRTEMSLARTALSSDRTLMSVVRTALSLIGFGFTIFQFFHKLSDQFIKGGLPSAAPRRFGAALIVLGLILLVLGIYTHALETHQRRQRAKSLYDAGLIHSTEQKRANPSMILAVMLLIVGLFAIARVLLSIGPF